MAPIPLSPRADANTIFSNPIYAILIIAAVLFVLGVLIWGMHAAFPNSVCFRWYGNKPLKRAEDVRSREELELIRRLRAGKRAEEEEKRRGKNKVKDSGTKQPEETVMEIVGAIVDRTPDGEKKENIGRPTQTASRNTTAEEFV